MWESASASRSDGLWEAAANGSVDDEVIELRNKAAVWSSTRKSFELDMLEVCENRTNQNANDALRRRTKITVNSYISTHVIGCC